MRSWFTSVKGSHPGIIQEDITLETQDISVRRGTVLSIEDGKFVPATTDGEGYAGNLFIALQDYDDSQSRMAGSYELENPGHPAISGVSIHAPGEYETSNFDFTSGVPSVGDWLAVNNGVFVKAQSPSDAVAVLTSGVESRYVNNADKSTSRRLTRQGRQMDVIRFRTAIKQASSAEIPIYVKFTALEDSTIDFGTTYYQDDGTYTMIPPTVNLEYSYDGKSWTPFDWENWAIDDVKSAGGDMHTTTELSVPAGTSLYVRCTEEGNAVWTDVDEWIYEPRLISTGSLSVSGNIMSLLSQTPSLELNTSFTSLMSVDQYGELTTNNGSIHDVSKDFLPATTLSATCYSYLFYGCESLVTAPDLPATTLAYDCYSSMFSCCTSLTEAPELPATTLTEDCYYGMFVGCASLTAAPELPATELASRCYYSMFSECTSLISSPELPATELTESCYALMFSGCTSLITAPELPATELTESCYSFMFNDCERLMVITTYAEDISASHCTDRWLDNTSEVGLFNNKGGVTTWSRGGSGIPVNWEVDPPLPPQTVTLTVTHVDAVGGDTIAASATHVNEIGDHVIFIPNQELIRAGWTAITPKVEFDVSAADDGRIIPFAYIKY